MTKRLEMEPDGRLEIWEQSPCVRLSAYKKNDKPGLYKVWLKGEGGEFLLGTLIPEGNDLTIRRTLSISTLKSCGCWPVTGAKAVMCYSFTVSAAKGLSANWHMERCPCDRFGDEVLFESAAAWGSMLLRECARGFELAVPFDPCRPFPLTPIFCFGRILPVNGCDHIVFGFTADGLPFMPT